MILSCKNIVKRYEGMERPVIDGVSFDLDEGCFVSVMGRSGSGKSTLLKVLCGLLTPDEGAVTVAGCDVHGLTAKEQCFFRSRAIGIVFQDNNLISDFNIEDNVFSPLYIAGVKPDTEYYGRLLKLTELEDCRRKMPSEISGGQRQRAAVARALIARPKIIFADEPTGSLDSKSEAQVMELFSAVNKEFGVSIVQVTHSAACAAAGRGVIYINDGKVNLS